MYYKKTSSKKKKRTKHIIKQTRLKKEKQQGKLKEIPILYSLVGRYE